MGGMSQREAMVVVGVALLAFALFGRVRVLALARDVPQGKLGGFRLAEIVWFLGVRYDQGLLHPRALAAMPTVSPPPADLLATALNMLVCVEIGSGRYREALEWRSRWDAHPSGDADALLRINEAEALACLGRFEESLSLVEPLQPESDWLRSARAAHRAWVLAELGRVEEARAELALPELRPGVSFPAKYVAELWFSRFAVAMAARDLDLARSALDEAERFIVRESSRRNLHFYRGRLAVAEGRPTDAVEAFERGGQSVYRAQGGPSLVEWGDTLMQLGRTEEAREKWERCLSEDSQSPAAKTATERLGALSRSGS